MDNFIFGIQNVASNINSTTLTLLRHPLVWGFALGALASTLLHLFVIVDNPRFIPKMITKKPSESFESVTRRDEKGVYKGSYSAFRRDYVRFRILLFTTIFAFLVVVIIALLRF